MKNQNPPHYLFKTYFRLLHKIMAYRSTKTYQLMNAPNQLMNEKMRWNIWVMNL